MHTSVCNLNLIQIKMSNISKHFAAIDDTPSIDKIKKNSLLPKYEFDYNKHFHPQSKEWTNSIYSYNTSYMKDLPVLDKKASSLIKSYFNLFNKKLERKVKQKTTNTLVKKKRLSSKKIFVSKLELKHTSDNVNITAYVHNMQSKIYTKTLISLDKIIKLNMLSGPEQVNLKNLKFKKYSAISVNSKNYLNDVKQLNRKIKDIKNVLLLKRLVDQEKEKYPKSSRNLQLKSAVEINALYNCIKEFMFYELKKIYYKHLLEINQFKFKDTFLFNLKRLMGKIYNKNIDINLVNLKYIYLNSNIFLDYLAIKIKHRKNNLLKTISYAVNGINLDLVNKITDVTYEKKGKILYFDSIYLHNTDASLKNVDFLSMSLKNFILIRNKAKLIKNLSIKNINKSVFNIIKHKTLSGVRLQVKGRLSKRATANKSIFKLKHKGSIKNIDSSYKKLSSNMIKGYFRSNLQYNKIKSKTRNGSFGIKGWLSSK